MARMSHKVWLAALLALALLAAPVLANDHSDKDADEIDDGEDVEDEVKLDKMAGVTTNSLGGKWPITKGVLGCIDYNTEDGECFPDGCLGPYFEYDNGVCICTEGHGLAPFSIGKKSGKGGKLMVCAPCPQGTFSSGGPYSTTLCQRCPLGSTTEEDTSASVDDCTVCQPGFAGVGPDCTLCPAGEWADPEDNTACVPCSDDGSLTTPKAGATSEDECYIAVCGENEQSVKGKCYECAEGWSSEAGNAAFGKYQPKCFKDPKERKFVDAKVKVGGVWKDSEGAIAEPKEHDKEAHVPDWEDAKEPKWAGEEAKEPKEPKEPKHNDGSDMQMKPLVVDEDKKVAPAKAAPAAKAAPVKA